MAVQSRVNGKLGAATAEPLIAACISFSVGLIVLLTALAWPSFRRGTTNLIRAIRTGTVRPWECLGGVIGGIFVAVQTSTVPVLGVALFTILIVGAQTSAAMLVDHLGLGPRGRIHITPRRLTGGLIAVAGVAISAFASSGASATFAFGAAVITFLVGAATQIQQALNGRVAKAAASPYATTMQNFVVGLIALLIVVAGKMLFVSADIALPQHTQWWYWIGGMLGIGFIGLTAWATRHISVLELGLTVLLGQLIMALALDLMDPHARTLITWMTIVGTLVTTTGAWVASRGTPRRRRNLTRSNAASPN